MEQTYNVDASDLLAPVVVKIPRCHSGMKTDKFPTDSFNNLRIIEGSETLDENNVKEESPDTKLDHEENADGHQLPPDSNITCKKSRRNPKMKRVGYGMYHVEGVVLETKEDMMERFENRREDLLAKLDRLLNDDDEEDVDDVSEEEEVEEVENDVEKVIVNITDIEEAVKETKGYKGDKWADRSVKAARGSTKDIVEDAAMIPTKPRTKTMFKLSLGKKKPNKSDTEAIPLAGSTQRYEGQSHSSWQIHPKEDTTTVPKKLQIKCPDSEGHIGTKSIWELEDGAALTTEAKPRSRFNNSLRADTNSNEEEVPNDSNDDSGSKGKSKKKSLWSTLSRLFWTK